MAILDLSWNAVTSSLAGALPSSVTPSYRIERQVRAADGTVGSWSHVSTVTATTHADDYDLDASGESVRYRVRAEATNYTPGAYSMESDWILPVGCDAYMPSLAITGSPATRAAPGASVVVRAAVTPATAPVGCSDTLTIPAIPAQTLTRSTPGTETANFSVTVTLGTRSFTLTASHTVTFTCSLSTLSCGTLGLSDASVRVGETAIASRTGSASGGTAPYRYVVTGNTYTQSTVGTVGRTGTIAVTDAAGCTVSCSANWDATFSGTVDPPPSDPCDTCSASISVTEPSPAIGATSATVTASVTVTGCGAGCASCTGTGTLSRTVTPSNPSYSFSQRVICGTYDETVTASGRVTFPQAPDPCDTASALSVTLTASNASANVGRTADSGATWVATGGVAPYSLVSLTGDTYACSSGGSSNRTASVTIEDDCGTRASDTDGWRATCIDPCAGCTSASISVTEPSPGACDDSATVTARASAPSACGTCSGTGALTSQQVTRASPGYSFSSRVICGSCLDETATASGRVTFPARASAPTCSLTLQHLTEQDTGETVNVLVLVSVSGGQGQVTQGSPTGDLSLTRATPGTATGTVTVRVTDACGQTSTCSAVWEVVFTDPPPPCPAAPTCSASAMQISNPSGCDDSATFEIIVTASGSGGTITGDGTFTRSVTRSSPRRTFTFTVNEATTGCPTQSATCSVTVSATFPARPTFSAPNVTYSYSKTTGSADEDFPVSTSATGGCGAVTGTTGTVNIPQSHQTGTNTFSGTFTARDGKGRTDSWRATITVTYTSGNGGNGGN